MICHHRHHHCHHHCEQKQGASHFVQVKELSDNHYRPHHHDRSHSHQQDHHQHEDQCATLFCDLFKSRVSLITTIDLTTMIAPCAPCAPRKKMIAVTLINKITMITNTKVQPTLAACSMLRAQHNRR